MSTPTEHRPRRWMAVITLAAGGWILLELAWTATGSPAAEIDYVAAAVDLAARHQPEGPNGWPHLVAAARISGEIDQEIEAAWRRADPDPDPQTFHPDYTLLRREPLDEEASRWEIEGLERYAARGVMAELAEAARCPRMLRKLDWDGSLWSVPLPNLARFRSLARMRVGSMRLAAQRGDSAEVVAAFEQTLAIVRACKAQSFVIDRLVGNAIFALVMDEVRHQLLRHGLDEATLRAMGEALDRQTAGLPPLDVVFENERLASLDLIQRSYSDDQHGDGRLSTPKFEELNGAAMMGGGSFDALGAFVLAPRGETTRVVNEYYDGLVSAARLSPAAYLAGEGFDAGAFMAELSFRHYLLKVLASSATRVFVYDDRDALTAAGLRIMLAVEAFRQARGSYPETLDDLVPRFLAALPADPSGGGFTYRTVEAVEAAEGEWPYLLYSLGADGVDDSADHDPGNPGQAGTFGSGIYDEGYDVLLTSPPGEPR